MSSVGGERSWSCAAVNRSPRTIGPPQLGRRHSGCAVGAVEVSDSSLGWSGAESGAASVGEEAEVADGDEALGEQVSRKRRNSYLVTHNLSESKIRTADITHAAASAASGFVLTGNPEVKPQKRRQNSASGTRDIYEMRCGFTRLGRMQLSPPRNDDKRSK